ncbi:hypothetical protein SA496_28325 [Pseudomonas sp. JS3066]|jgi:hypothetical protein|uniref:hypothetical protein n=1 Tax=unclassified Pseudomonas TaxID=196821 RepID=UPI000EAA20E3|nr:MULTISPECIES: hypothetical protein [unclassified Pseudomonas]AYF88890.1 hypothetical protein D6Z43_17735 [Pseudomonas sp. DY-1]MDH4653421.1 hypothetical protein [Pseudomonas sp. BN606]MRK22347.1 hypothetical protein [Pseudomonas sp. JG-B]WVK93568.1 hypothetical protein SA496_28325 [Pseudomonas sp. JS3066]
MSDYRISLRRDDVLFAEISVSQARYVEMTREMRKRFPREEGFSLHIERRRELRRILEQGPDGLRLLGVEYRHEEVPEHA